MLEALLANKDFAKALQVLQTEVPLAIWETFYVTVISTVLALVLGLPLGVLLVVGEKNGILPLPGWILKVLNVLINLLRSAPFIILLFVLIPFTRLIVYMDFADRHGWRD